MLIGHGRRKSEQAIGAREAAGDAPPRPEIQLVDTGVIVESTFLGNSHNVVVESASLGRTAALLYDGEEPRGRGERVSVGWEARHARTIPE